MRFFLVFFAIFGVNLGVNVVFALDSSHSNLIFKNLDSLESIKNNVKSYAVSEKFDGIRGIWDGQNMFSKSGKILVIPPCFAEKLAILDLPKGAFVEGELWIKYGRFEEISGIMKRKNPTCADFEGVKYLIFNAQFGESKDFLANLTRISSSLQESKANEAIQTNTPQIQVIEQHKFNDIKELRDFFDKVISMGGEGIILRDSHTAFKMKARHDAECKIIDYTRGKGRLSGKVGAIICESLADNNSGIKKGVIFRIGSGLSDEMRTNPPKIGTIITYKFSGISNNGVPRHTRFWRIYAD